MTREPPRVAMLFPDAFRACHFYKPLFMALTRAGCRVWVLSRGREEVEALGRLGVNHLEFTFSRFVSPWRDLCEFLRLVAAIRRHHFDIVHSFYLKLGVCGALAARLSGVKRVLWTIEGLGFTYRSSPGASGTALRLLVDQCNRVAGRLSDMIWFVNREDRDYFVSRGFVGRPRTLVTRGHGIDLEAWDEESRAPRSLDILRREVGLVPQAVAVTMVVSRAIWSKGIGQFVEMASLLRERAPQARCILLAPPEPEGPDAVPPSYLERAAAANPNLCWLGRFRRDVADLLRISDVVVLPSYYGEGFPTVLLEAMVLGKPIVTTHSVGCREAVAHGVNGYLVPPRDVGRLLEAVVELVNDPGKRAAFGARSREAAEECDSDLVVRRVLEELYGLRS